MTKARAILLSAVVFATNQATSRADAWVQKRGEGLAIYSINIQSHNTVNSIGQFDKSRRIQQVQHSIYGEFGLTNRLTIGGKIFATDNMLNRHNSVFSKNIKRSFGLNSGLLFTRLGLIRNSEIVALSLVTAIETPSYYHSNIASYYGLKKWQYETRAELGININKSNFLVFGAGYHGNINHWYDEVRFDVLYGHYFIPELLFMVRFQKYVYIVKNRHKAVMSYGKFNVSVFDFLTKSGFAKLTMSFATNVSDHVVVEFGGYSSIKSKLTFTQKLNIQLYGGFASVWVKI